MKTFKLFTVALLVLSMLATAVGAVEFVPSAEREAPVVLVDSVKEEIDTPCRTVVVIPYEVIHLDEIDDIKKLGLSEDGTEKVSDEIRESLTAALQQLRDNSLETLVADFGAAWKAVTGGAPIENAVVSDLFEVALVCAEAEELKTDETITVIVKAYNIDADDKFLVIHQPASTGEWIVEEYTVNEDGNIVMTLDELSPFAIIKDSEKEPSTDKDSPQTGVTETTAGAAAMAVILAAGAVLCAKKLKKTTAQ